MPQSSLSMHDIHECSDEEVITTWMTDVLSLSGDLCACAWVIGGDGDISGGGDGGGVGVGVHRTVCRDPVQPRFGHILSCRPRRLDGGYLLVPDVQRKKCYKIPPENELCLCEDIFQQHQAKLVDCDAEDANAVESYKEPGFDSENENAECSDDVGGEGEKCCCEGGGAGSSTSSTSSSSASARVVVDDGRKSSVASSSSSSAAVAATDALALQVVDRGSGQLSNRLTARERDKVLRELDDIVSGNFLTKVRRFSEDVQSNSSGGGGDNDDDLHYRGGHQQQLQLTAAPSRFLGKRSSSLDTDEIVNYGKVAELTRRFSRLGEAGVITPKHYCSEPNFFRESTGGVVGAASVRHLPYHRRRDEEDDEGSSSSGDSGEDYEVVRQPIRMVFISPMSVSDDRLNSKSDGGGLVLTEVTSDGEIGSRRPSNCSAATQNRRRSFRKSVAFDSSLSSVDGDEATSAAATRYLQLKGGGGGMWQSAIIAAGHAHSKSTDTVSVSNVGRMHRRCSSVDVYDQAATAVKYLDVEKAEREFRDCLLAEKSRRHEAIREYMANKELLLMKMKSASVGGVLRWNQEHQDTLLDEEEPPPPSSAQHRWPLPDRDRWQSAQQLQWSSDDVAPGSRDDGNVDDDDNSEWSSPKDGLRRVLHNGLKGRRIRRLRKLESRSSGFALADLCRVTKSDELPASSPHRCNSTSCSSAEPPFVNRNHKL